MKKIFPLFSMILPSFLMAQIYNIANFGAQPNGPINTTAIQAAIDTCSITGGVVQIPLGNFYSGGLILKSNVTLRVDGVLLGATNVNQYPVINPTLASMADALSQRALIYAEGVNNIKISGSGKIDGNGISFLGQGNNRPFLIRLISCKNVVYENVELRNAGFWMMHNLNIDTLTMRNLVVFNNSNSNNDGIGIDACRNVLIENCTVNSLDDALVLKTTTPLNCEDVIVRNCTLSTAARAIKIGTETTGGFKNIRIENCTVLPRVPAADCGINLAIVDGGFIDNLLLDGINISGVKTALMIRLGNQARRYIPSAPVPPVGYIKNITLRNINIASESNVTSTITGIPGYYVENISLENVRIAFPGGEQVVAPGYTVPERENQRPNCDIFGDTLPAHGLYARHVKNLQLRDVCFQATEKDFRPALVLDDVISSALFGVLQGDSNIYCIQPLTSEIRNMELPSFSVFPDVANNAIHLQSLNENSSKQLSIKVFDVNGTFMREIQSPFYTSLTIPFDYYNGIYFCVVRDDAGHSATTKFLWLKH